MKLWYDVKRNIIFFSTAPFMDINTIVIIAFYLIILLYSIILHEIAHGLVALKLGDRTALMAGRLTLNPKSHIDPLGSILLPIGMLFLSGFRFAFGWAKPVPFNPRNLSDAKWGPVLVALGGPATNFALAFIAAIIGMMLPVIDSSRTAIISGVFRSDWGTLAQMITGSVPNIFFLLCMIAIFWNVLLAIFNLLPIPPLDGSKLLYALVPIPERTQVMLEQYGFFILIAVVFLFPAPLHYLLNIGWSFFFSIAS